MLQATLNIEDEHEHEHEDDWLEGEGKKASRHAAPDAQAHIPYGRSR